jgi:inhibitor of KinA sporulation pathway (predicted exonuclease)
MFSSSAYENDFRCRVNEMIDRYGFDLEKLAVVCIDDMRTSYSLIRFMEFMDKYFEMIDDKIKKDK